MTLDVLTEKIREYGKPFGKIFLHWKDLRDLFEAMTFYNQDEQNHRDADCIPGTGIPNPRFGSVGVYIGDDVAEGEIRFE